MRVLGIVGAEAAKFTPFAEMAARRAIVNRLTNYDVVASGHCHLGGVDIWAEEEAKILGKFDPAFIFPPKQLNWSHGYKPRNLKIADACTDLLNIVVDSYPPNYAGMKFSICYHCAKHSDEKTSHVKSGGCWTMWQAYGQGKGAELLIVPNTEYKLVHSVRW